MFKWNRVLVALIGVPLLLFIYAGESFFRINLYGLPMLNFYKSSYWYRNL